MSTFAAVGVGLAGGFLGCILVLTLIEWVAS